MKSNASWLLLAFSFFALASVNGQNENAPQVSLKIDFVAWGDSLKNLTVMAGTKQVPVIAEAYNYSTPLSYLGSNVLELYQNSGAPANPPAGEIPPALAAARKTKPGLVGLVSLPLNSKRVTILLAPGPGGTYQTYVIDDDPSKLPFGQVRIHNYSSDTIAFRCHGKVLPALKPGQSTMVSAVDRMIPYELAYQRGEKWKVQENNVLPVPENQQVQMIVLKTDNGHFVSTDGTKSGYLQLVTLRRAMIEPQAAAQAP